MLIYAKYDDLDIDKELNRIEEDYRALINLYSNEKECLFVLGMLFAKGIKIDLLNMRDLKIDTEGKSFDKMAFVWNMLGIERFTNDSYELGRHIVEARKRGLKVERIENKPIDKKIFLICPVRNATSEQRRWIEDFVREKQEEEYIVHAPHLHTKQVDVLGGYNICRENAEAVASSSEVDVYYDQTSKGSVFDLGVAYALHKPLKVLNEEEIIYDENDFIDRTICQWPYNEKEHKLILK